MTGTDGVAAAGPSVRNSDLWLTRATSAGFAAGSALFSAGAVVALAAQAKPANVLFLVGSLFFTAAATVQWRLSVRHHPCYRDARQRAEWDFHNPDWAAAVIQLAGTVFFNVMTLRSLLMVTGKSAVPATMAWRPDVIGSILFLVSSLLALRPIVRRVRHQLILRRSLRISRANVIGSVAFTLSASASYVTPLGQPVAAKLSDAATLAGGLLFLAGAVLLWPTRKPGRADPQDLA